MKTIKEKMDEIRIFNANNSLDILGVSDFAFKKGVEFAQRWIPVKEELPTKEGVYLVKRHNNYETERYIMSTQKGYW